MAKAMNHDSNSDIALIVQNERKALQTAFNRVSKSKKTAKAFLVRAGILNKSGELAESYRQPE